MLEFSEKLTLLPCDMKETDVKGLRGQGFSDREILSITLAAAYRNFITRVADALGVELRQGENYTPEILHAFGVTEEEAQTTMYRGRQVARESGAPGRLPAGTSRTAPASERVSWIGTGGGPSQEENDGVAAGFPRNLARALSLRPEAFGATLAFGRLAGMGDSGLGRRLEAVVGLTVAASLGVSCRVAHHAKTLREAGASANEVRALMEDPGAAGREGFDAKEQAVVRFCEKLTRLPSPMARSDLEAVGETGFADRELLTIVASASFENFLGRVAAGVGVGLETEREASTAVGESLNEFGNSAEIQKAYARAIKTSPPGRT